MAISLQYIIRHRQGESYYFSPPAFTLSIKMLPGSRCAKPTQIAPQITSGADCYLMYENTNLKYLEIHSMHLIGLSEAHSLAYIRIVLCLGRLMRMTLIWWVTFKLSNPLGCCEGLWEKMEGGLQPQNDAVVLCQSVCWWVNCVFISIC